MVVFINGGASKSSMFMGFSIRNHPFWGTPIDGNPAKFEHDSETCGKIKRKNMLKHWKFKETKAVKDLWLWISEIPTLEDFAGAVVKHLLRVHNRFVLMMNGIDTQWFESQVSFKHILLLYLVNLAYRYTTKHLQHLVRTNSHQPYHLTVGHKWESEGEKNGSQLSSSPTTVRSN